jgi:hypothetical protein
MALRFDRHRIRPIAALALDAGTTIGPRCATIHVGQEAECLHSQAGYTTAADTKGCRQPPLACHPGGVHIRAASGNGQRLLSRFGHAGRCESIILGLGQRVINDPHISMNIAWIILSLTIAAVVAKRMAWDDEPDAQSHLGFVSHQWLADHCLSQMSDPQP